MFNRLNGRAAIRGLAAVLLGVTVTGICGARDLTDAAYAKWRDYVAEKAPKSGSVAIPWRPSFWEGVVEAQARDRPLLLWTMNGHPLGCT